MLCVRKCLNLIISNIFVLPHIYDNKKRGEIFFRLVFVYKKRSIPIFNLAANLDFHLIGIVIQHNINCVLCTGLEDK